MFANPIALIGGACGRQQDHLMERVYRLYRQRLILSEELEDNFAFNIIGQPSTRLRYHCRDPTLDLLVT